MFQFNRGAGCLPHLLQVEESLEMLDTLEDLDFVLIEDLDFF